jgi:hypothetical protein
MARHCPVTGDPVDQCDCGSCEPEDDELGNESWRMVPFIPLSDLDEVGGPGMSASRQEQPSDHRD